MRKKLKIGLGIGLLALGAITFSSCTQSFCSTNDTAHILYRYDYGVTEYWNKNEIPEEKKTSAKPLWGSDAPIWYTTSIKKSKGLENIVNTARNNGLPVVYDLEYWERFDKKVLDNALNAAGKTLTSLTRAEEITSNDHQNPGVLSEFGYLKFFDDKNKETTGMWNNWDITHQQVMSAMAEEGKIDKVPTTDFVNFYKNTMSGYVGNFRACLATQDGYYGNYGYGIDDKDEVFIKAKDWGYAWSKGFFEGLLVYPIGFLVDNFANGMRNAGATAGVAAILSLIFVTLIVRGIMLIFTFKQSTETARMNELQPQIQKIQDKYPNSKTNKYEKQRMGEEMQKLYKKNNIHPFRSIITLVIQFPIFICVWGALQGSSVLSSGSFLGLNLNASIREVLFDGAYWSSANMGGLTALFLFILMAAAQAVSMLLPQWIQKSKAKKAAKLGKNPSTKSQNNKMKWFTYIMLALIIVMGFSLVSAMGVYWLIGALVSIAQTLITQWYQGRKTRKEKGNN